MDNDEKTQEENKNIIHVSLEKEMKRSYLDYSMSVIVGRALPDVRDGLKPVHRRVLYAMYDTSLLSNKPYRKSARLVGEVLGKYHPHGDTAVYDTIVRMAQDFSYNHTLVDGHGNFGSVDGDSAAAMRYTEIRMSKISEELLRDINKETVNFKPNFDDSLKEPCVLPSVVPNLLLNGSEGIAVGMATKMPPHNLREVCNAVIMQMDNPDVPITDLTDVLLGPDFPTGGLMYGKTGIMSAYKTGRGKIKLRARAVAEGDPDTKERIIITELPYQVNKANLIKKIAGLVSDKVVEGIRDIRDESDRDGMRVVIELSKAANSQVTLNQLFRHTDMEITYGIINLALVDNRPRVLALNEIIAYFIDHRIIVITKRTEFELRKAEARAHILEGLRIALSNIDDIVTLIKSSKSKEEAKERLIEKYSFSEIQADAILAMRLSTLTGLERDKIDEEYDALLKLIARLKEILASREEIMRIIKNDLIDIKERYGHDRLTEIALGGDIDMIEDEDLIPREEMVVTITEAGYIKRVKQDEYKAQRRGGKGVIGMTTKEEDSVADMFTACTHDYLLFFSDKGQIRWRKVYELPEGGRYSKGRSIVNVLDLKDGEEIRSVLPSNELDDKHYITMVSRNGVIKKTSAALFARPRKGGIRALTLREGDDLVSVSITDGEKDIFIGSYNGKAIHFNENEIRPMGRTAAGVRGIKLNPGDYVIGMAIADSDGCILTISERGYGKRTLVSEYRETKRGGKGVRNLLVTDKTGNVMAVRSVVETDELMLTSAAGKLIRTYVSDISIIGRSTQGVRIMRIDDDDKVMAVSIIPEKEDDGEESEGDAGTDTKDDDSDSKEIVDDADVKEKGLGAHIGDDTQDADDEETQDEEE